MITSTNLPLHACWIIDLYGHICKQPQIIINDFNNAGIIEAVNEATTILYTVENPLRGV